MSIKIADKAFEACSEDNVRELLPIRAFSQKQLSAVGARLDELRRFVYAPIQAGLAVTEERIAGLKSDIRAAFALVERQRALENEVAAHALERTSGTESGGKIKLTGAIDVPAIRTEIIDVMEGGADAFQLRKTKYGF